MIPPNWRSIPQRLREGSGLDRCLVLVPGVWFLIQSGLGLGARRLPARAPRGCSWLSFAGAVSFLVGALAAGARVALTVRAAGAAGATGLCVFVHVFLIVVMASVGFEAD